MLVLISLLHKEMLFEITNIKPGPLSVLKGIVHPKMKMLSHSHVFLRDFFILCVEH